MVCIYCGGSLSVSNSRAQKRNNRVWRRRRCSQCQAIFTTHEAIDSKKALLVDKNGKLEAFLPDRLYTELLLALQDHAEPYVAARELTDTVTQKLLKQSHHPVFAASDISHQAGEVLRRFDKRSWLRYQAEHPSIID